jgi:glycosyltransferase involved in cell wall biosynthesis
MCSDGGDVQLKREDLSGFPFSISYTYAEHSGVCHTRNMLLDKSTSEYLMFCDVDDTFNGEDGLYTLLKKAKETGADVVATPYSIERKEKDGFTYGLIEKDTLRVHGKIFRREYLYQNSIRFPDEMETSGDMMFLWLAFALTDNVVWVDKNFYVWRWNSTSVTRGISWHHIRTYDRTLRCYTLLAEDLKKRNRVDLYSNLLATLFGMVYVDITHQLWSHAPREYQIEAERHIRKLFRTYYADYVRIDAACRKAKYYLMLNYTGLPNNETSFNRMLPWINSFMKKPDVLIIGYGTVGHNLEHELLKLKPALYDKYKGIDERELNLTYKVAFICVDTPYKKDCPCDITEVRNAILENSAEIFVIKSTVLPGTVDRLCRETGKNIIFSPEYYGGTQHCNNYNFDFTILGGEKKHCQAVVQLLQHVYDGRHQFRFTDAKTAELVKYMENCYLATKVSFCAQFYNIAEQLDVSYEELRELFILDPRVEESHTFIYRNAPYWDSHCLNKDTAALAAFTQAPLLNSIIQFNKEQKEG